MQRQATFPTVKNSFVGRYGFRENHTNHGMHYSCPKCGCDDVWVELTVYNTRQQMNVATCNRCGHQGVNSTPLKRLAVKIPLKRAAS